MYQEFEFKFSQFQLLIFILMMAAHSAGFAQNPSEDPFFDKFFQKFNEKDNWEIMGEPQFLTGRELLDTGEGLAEYLVEYQVENGFRWTILFKKDSILLNLAVYEALNQNLAFGLFSVEKSPSLKFYDIGFKAYRTGRKLICWYGSYVIYVQSADSQQVKEKLLKEPAEETVKILPRQKENLPILMSLPSEDRVEHSEKYYVGRWLDQEYFRNIYYADYYTPEGYSRIFIINNITTASADSNFWRYHSFMKKNSTLLTDSLEINTDYFAVDEPLWGKTILAKKNQIIYGILDYRNKKWTEDRMRELLDELKDKKVVKSG